MTEKNPEADVVAWIDGMLEADDVDSYIDSQLARGPVDDYSRNYYPACPRCGHDWHGARCEDCGCTRCDGEVSSRDRQVFVDQVQGVRFATVRGVSAPYHYQEHFAPRERREVNWQVNIGQAERIERALELNCCPQCGVPLDAVQPGHVDGCGNRGYTLADLEAMRAAWHAVPQRYVLGDIPQHRARFSTVDPHGVRRTVTGNLIVDEVRWRADRHPVIQARLVEPIQLDTYVPAEAPIPEEPIAIPDNEPLIGIEYSIPDGFRPLGVILPDDINFVEERNEVVLFGGGVVRVQEHHEVSFNVQVVEEHLRDLLGEGNFG